VYPESFATLQRPCAAVCDRYLSSRSPPLHLLYQMLKMVPVGGGASVLNVAASTCGRAGRRLRRIIFLTRLPSALVVMMTWSVVEAEAGTRAVAAEGSSTVREGSSSVEGASVGDETDRVELLVLRAW
jgi:hypothetical protein